MKRGNRIALTILCSIFIILSWVVVLGSKSNSEKQAELIEQAVNYMSDEVYILAVPLLEEAAGYNDAHTIEAEELLKKAYLELIEQSGFRRKYTSLLEKQMNRKDVGTEIFIEAANFYLKNSKLADAFTVLKKGIAQTGSEELIDLYEENRYVYKLGYDIYEDVTSIYGSTIGIKKGDLWGFARSDGTLIIRPQYEKISNFSSGRAIVQKNGVISAIDTSNNRLALLKEDAFDFGNYANGRVALLTKEGWKYASGEFRMDSTAFEEIGTYSGGYAAAKQNGKWGVIDLSLEWIIPPEYDEVKMDELGRSYGQDAVFVRKGDSVYLMVEGQRVGEGYDDAKPFKNEGYAAVKKNGKWGFIDTSGQVIIDYQFEDALSFGQHLAAVKQDGHWGYISIYGKMVIEPIFLEAKSFLNGNAPVLTERGWQFISLLEYKKGVGL